MSTPLILKSHGSDEGTGEYLVVTESPFRFGRKPGNDAQIIQPDVSGVHAEIRFEAGFWFVHDNNSTNGTFVNGKRIDAPVRLSTGDVVHFATRGFQVVPNVDRREDNMFSTKVLTDSSEIRGMVDLLAIVNEQRAYPFFQKIIDLKTEESVGYEALGRAPTIDGVQSPGALFWLAGLNKVEGRLSRTFRDAARDCVQCQHCWPNESGAQLPYIFVNLHPAELGEKKFMESLEEFSRSDMQRLCRIVLEMPESWACRVDEMQVIVREIRELGMRVAYDDFGQGQSRISDLLTVPPDFLKLDRQLIASLATQKVKHNLVKAIVDACRDLRVRTLGEGVETVDEKKACIDLGIDLGQGFLFGRPAPAYEVFGVGTPTLPASCPFIRLEVGPKPAVKLE
ncbi:MAG: EAL domain-containing protein [Planctomycetia bacterium]